MRNLFDRGPPDSLPKEVRSVRMGGDGGAFTMQRKKVTLRIIASIGEGWDHVSVSLPHRCPTWEEMDAVKRAFFLPDEVVMQLHPAEDNHINIHPNCLHLWRPHDREIPLPPTGFV